MSEPTKLSLPAVVGGALAARRCEASSQPTKARRCEASSQPTKARRCEASSQPTKALRGELATYESTTLRGELATDESAALRGELATYESAARRARHLRNPPVPTLVGGALYPDSKIFAPHCGKYYPCVDHGTPPLVACAAQGLPSSSVNMAANSSCGNGFRSTRFAPICWPIFSRSAV